MIHHQPIKISQSGRRRNDFRPNTSLIDNRSRDEYLNPSVRITHQQSRQLPDGRPVNDHHPESSSVNHLLVSILFLLTASFITVDSIHSEPPWGDNSGPLLSEQLYIELKGLKGFSVREFNRVDGFAPTFRIGFRGVEEGQYPSLQLDAIYYIEREAPGWRVAIEKIFFEPTDYAIRFEYFRLTDTSDRWRISDIENSLGSFLFKEDFRNYHENRGFRFSFDMEVGFFHQLTIAYTDHNLRSLSAGNPFTLFGWGKEFRANPSIREGAERRLLFRWIYDSRDNMRFPRTGWYNAISFETSPDSFHGDYSYRLFIAHMRRYNMIFGNQGLNFRFSLGLDGGDLPAHRLFTLGGVGTLRGYPDVSDSGTNFILGNAEYRFPIKGLTWKPLRILFNEIQGIFFFDVGDAWTGNWETSGLRTNLGAGISGANIFSYFGLYVAQALESDPRNPRVTVKMERDF